MDYFVVKLSQTTWNFASEFYNRWGVQYESNTKRLCAFEKAVKSSIIKMFGDLNRQYNFIMLTFGLETNSNNS